MWFYLNNHLIFLVINPYPTVQYSCGARLLLVEGGAGALQFHHALLTLPNIKTNLISEQWTENHYRCATD